MSNRLCSQCGNRLGEEKFFCPYCGMILDREEVNSSPAARTVEFKMARIRSNLLNIPTKSVKWDNTINDYVKNMEAFKAMLGIEELRKSAGQSLLDDMDSFIQSCCDPEFQIAFVGTIKTGKSTLINALLGKNYASMAVTPETAALTKFRCSEQDYVKVTFYSQREWDKLWKSISTGADKFMEEYKKLGAEGCKSQWVGHEVYRKELSNSEIEGELAVWSSSKRPEHYFVKEIEVGISTLPQDFPKSVVFVDTPGLSDPVAYRSEITKRYIRSANAVFVCVEAKKLNKEEVETISSVFSISSQYKEKVFIIATHWDKLNNPCKDWIEAGEFMARQLTGKGSFESANIARSHIIYSSAYLFNLCRDYPNLNEDDEITLENFARTMKLCRYLSPEVIPRIVEMTNIDTIKSVISEKLIRKHLSYIRDDLISRYNEIVSKIVSFAGENKNAANKIIAASKGSLDELEKHIQEAEQRSFAIRDSKKMLNDALIAVSKHSMNRLDSIIRQLDKVSE